MKRTWLYMVVSLLLPAVFAAGCSGGGGGGGISGGGSSSKAITAFGIVNPAATGTVNEGAKTISVSVPFGTDPTALTATFTTTGTSVVVGSTVQVSGVTVNNFSIPVVYTVNAADGTTQNYTVTVTVASSSAKALSSFAIVSPPAPGVIDETAKTVSVTVPFGTDVTALTATFTTTGAGVTVGGTAQVSGITTNDFTNSVEYAVRAADGSIAKYTVTVTVAPSSAKAITSYSILGVAGIINEIAKTISVNLPEGTVVTALTATFTTTGAGVAIGGTAQVSGVTQQDFTNKVVYTVTAADGSGVDYYVTVAFIVLGTPISSPTVSPITSFGQALASHDTGTLNAAYGYYQESFPGQANVWDIDADFTLADGGDYQFFYALWLGFTDLSHFGDTSQTYGGLTFYGPTMGTAQGVTVAAVSDGASTGVTPLAGSYSAFLNATSDSRLMQTLNVASGVTGTITLTWKDSVNLYNGHFTSSFTPSYRVVIRDTGGAELDELYSTATSTSGVHTADLNNNYVNQGYNIVLSFEERSAPAIASELGLATPQLTMIDSVSALDSASTPYVTNGDFENGLTGWTTNTPAEVQNMTSSIDYNHDGLDVTRSFYTVPNKLWGRWVDVFVNNTSSAITTTLDYNTVLGSYGTAIIYDTPSTSNRAITAWDGSQTTRDIGMVFGNADQVDYASDTGLNAGNGSDTIDFYYNITVPPAGRVALVNFIILGTYDTSLTAADTSAYATEIDNEAQNIVNNFWTDPQYRDGMTQQQIDAIINFPH